MQEYPVRRGHAKKTDLKATLQQTFGVANQEGDWVAGRYGAMPKIRARYQGSDRLAVDTETDRGAPMTVAAETIKLWNQFLEAATGYTSKQRAKKIQEEAKKAAG